MVAGISALLALDALLLEVTAAEKSDAGNKGQTVLCGTHRDYRRLSNKMGKFFCQQVAGTMPLKLEMIDGIKPRHHSTLGRDAAYSDQYVDRYGTSNMYQRLEDVNSISRLDNVGGWTSLVLKGISGCAPFALLLIVVQQQVQCEGDARMCCSCDSFRKIFSESTLWIWRLFTWVLFP